MKKILPVEKRFLNFPVCNAGHAVKVNLSEADGASFCPLEMVIATLDSCDFVASYPMARFGRRVAIECEDESFFDRIFWSDEVFAPAPYDIPERQQFHYSANHGWLNDPNGLFWLNGEWHLFHQYNPFSRQWGNMHWRHAVSPDRIHWQELDTVIAPGAEGMAFSGGAVVDCDNTSGLQVTPGVAPVLLFYTAAGKTSTQRMLFSVDGGKSFTSYDKNPVVPTIGDGDDRDPAVAWDPEAGEWVMLLYRGDRSRNFAVLTSQNLLDWREVQRFAMPNGRECPEILRLRDEVTGQFRWVMLEANGFYLVGDRRGGAFVWEEHVGDFLHERGQFHAYAGQCFKNAPDGKCHYLAWQAGRMRHRAFSQAMALPVELRLSEGRLLTFPDEALRSLRVESYEFKDVRPFEPLPVKGDGLWEIELETPEEQVLQLALGGTQVTFDGVRGFFVVEGGVFDYPDKEKSFCGSIFLDRNSLEFFDAEGRLMTAVDTAASATEPVVFGNPWPQGQAIPSLKLHRLKSIWKD